MPIMKEVKIPEKAALEVEDILCNKCGSSCRLGIQQGIDDGYGLIEVTVEGGYFSKHLEDLSRYTFSLCETCIHEYFQTFKYPPHVVSYL